MIQTQILTSASPAQQQTDTQQGFQVRKARNGAAESSQKTTQAFRSVSRQQTKHSRQSTEQSAGNTRTDQSKTVGQTSQGFQAGQIAGEQAGFYTQEQAALSPSSLSKPGQGQEQQDVTDSSDTSGIAAILSDILNAQQQRLSKAEQESHAHSNRISAKLAATTGEQNQQLKGQQTAATTASDKLSQLTQADKLTVSSAALSQTDKVALKSALMSVSAAEGQATPSAATSAALQSLSTSATQTQHTAGTANPASAGGAEWAAVRVDPQSGKWGEQMLSILHDRVTLQAQQNLQEAKIRLDPPELGKLDLMVRVDGDKLNVQIHASSTATREALMQVSDRLRTELQNQNFMHVDVNVGSEHQSEGQSYTGQEDEATIFASRSDHHPDDNHTSVTSEHWLNTQA